MHWPRLRRMRTFARLLALLALLPVTSAADEERDLPPWVPSLGIGVGIQARTIDGDISALLFDGTAVPTRRAPCNTLIFFIGPGFCDLSDSDTRSVDGAALQGGGQLLGPSLDVFLRPRPFVHGGFDWAFDSRTVAQGGMNPSSFQENGAEADIRTRLRGNPEYLWYVGGGVALQLPVDFTTAFVKLGAHYMQERSEVVGTIDRSLGSSAVQTVESTDELTIPGIGPSFGLEAEIYRFGPVALNFVADMLVTFPLSGTDTQFQLDEPNFGGDPPPCTTEPPGTARCVSPATFSYDADEPHWLGSVSLRFGWVGY